MPKAHKKTYVTSQIQWYFTRTYHPSTQTMNDPQKTYVAFEDLAHVIEKGA